MARKKRAQTNKSKKKRTAGADKIGQVLPGVAPDPGGGTGATTGSSYADGRKSRAGMTSGPVPNLFWGEVSMDELRACPRFVGLPGPAQPQPPLPCLAATRYLRQDSPEWRQLHTGVLTTGLLKEALGLREPLAARVVGGRKESSHAPLLAAFQHLQQQPLLPPQLSDAKQEAVWRRQAVQGMLQLRRLEQTNPALPQAGDQQQERYLHCLAAVRNRGLVGVRCGWGKVQEGAALAQLLHIFPTSTLHEVGLCCIPTSAPATAPWPGLPPLAASPDAIIAHHLLLQPGESEQLRAALADLGNTTGFRVAEQQQQQQQQQLELQGAQPSLAFVTYAADQRLRQLLRELLDEVPMSLGRGGSDGRDGEGNGSSEGGDSGGRSGGGNESNEDASGADDGGADANGAFKVLGGHDIECTIGGGEDRGDDYGSDDGNCAEVVDSESDACCGIHANAEDASCGNGGGGGSAGGAGPWETFTTDAAITGIAVATAAAAAGVTVSPLAANVVTPEVGTRATSTAAVDVVAGSAAPASVGAAAAPATMLQSGVLAAVLESRLPVVLLCAACGGCSDDANGVGEPQAAATAPSSVTVTGKSVNGASLDVGGAFGCTAFAVGPLAKSYTGAGDQVAAGDALIDSKANAVMASVAESDSDSIVKDMGPLWNPATPDALLCACISCNSGHSSSSSSSAAAVPIRCDNRTAAATAVGGDGGEGIGGGAAAEALGEGHHSAVHVVLREVVEIKNTCPFGMRQVRRGGKGHMVSELFVSDLGPRQAVSPLWVPQLQLHMLATGCQSGLLISRSATKGTTVFRMFRDDDYLHRMLGILERFTTEYVRRGVSPPRDMFAQQAEYAAFLGATARLARTAVQLTAGSPWRPAPWTQPQSDSRGVAGTAEGSDIVWRWPYNRIDGALGGLSQGVPDRAQAFLGGA